MNKKVENTKPESDIGVVDILLGCVFLAIVVMCIWACVVVSV